MLERKQVEEAWRQSEDRFRTIFEKAAYGMVTTRPDGHFLQVNPAFSHLVGYSEYELLNMRMSDIIHPGDREGTRRFLEEINAGRRQLIDLEKRFVRKDGSTVWGHTTAVWLFDVNGRPVQSVVLVQDITNRKSLEEQLQQAQKMEAVGRLAGGIAHDFNNLLTAILGHSELLLSSFEPGDRLRKDVAEIKKAGEIAAALTRQLLAFSRKQILEPRVINLNYIVGDMETMLRRVIGEDVELVTETDPNLGLVTCDPGQMEQIILNLAVNARDAMPQGGQLTIETANQELNEAYASKHVSVKAGRYVKLTVRDTGCGMEAETKAHMFEPFFTTKIQGRGTGLGLSMVYGIVQQSEGHIDVHSELGQGTTFRIYFPRVAEGVSITERAHHVVNGTSGSETILLVEDEEIVRSLVCNVLQAQGYSVLEAESGPEALKISEAHEGRIDLMLTDIVMPQMSGRELAHRLSLLRPEMRILYMSGYTDDTTVPDKALGPGTLLLQKPFTPEILMSRVRQVLDTAM